MFVVGLATCFYQSDEAGVDALEGRGIDETAIAEAAEAGTFELPRHQIIATGEVNRPRFSAAFIRVAALG